MKNVKKNNKGFSLVELIVVVMIMAIIAVALAPQVMKWVNNSRIATDKQTVDSVVSACQTALTNTDAYAQISKLSSDLTFTLGENGATYTPTTNKDDKFYTAVNEIMSLSDAKMKSGVTVTITVTKAGKVSSNAATVLTSSDLN